MDISHVMSSNNCISKTHNANQTYHFESGSYFASLNLIWKGNRKNIDKQTDDTIKIIDESHYKYNGEIYTSYMVFYKNLMKCVFKESGCETQPIYNYSDNISKINYVHIMVKLGEDIIKTIWFCLLKKILFENAMYPNILNFHYSGDNYDEYRARKYYSRLFNDVDPRSPIKDQFTFYNMLYQKLGYRELNLGSLYDIDFIEVPICGGCLHHKYDGYVGIYEHQYEYGCLKHE